VEVNGHRHHGYQEQTVWSEPFHEQLAPRYDETPAILAAFEANIRSRGLADVVGAHRGTTATFAVAAGADLRARLLFIDGDHGYRAVVRDIDRLTPFLVTGGWICFDDAGSGYEGVDRAIADRIVNNPVFDLARQMTRKCFAARRSAVDVR